MIVSSSTGRPIKLCAALILAFAVTTLIGCNQTAPAPGKPADKQKSSQEAKGKGGEATARQKLKLALDSWAFGDETEKFEKDHPDISLYDERTQILPFGLDRPVKLIKYDIGAGRTAKNMTDKYEFTYEFAVAMSVQNAKGDASKSATYKVGKLKDGKWAVIGEGQ